MQQWPVWVCVGPLPQLGQLCCSDAARRSTSKSGHRTPPSRSCWWRSRLKIFLFVSLPCVAYPRVQLAQPTPPPSSTHFFHPRPGDLRLRCRSLQSDVCLALRAVSEDSQALILAPTRIFKHVRQARWRWLVLLTLLHTLLPLHDVFWTWSLSCWLQRLSGRFLLR